MLINILVLLVGIYCVLESVSAAAEMHKGDRFCRLAKYLLAGSSGLYVISVAMHSAASIGMLILITAVALGLWPRMVYRITGGRRNTDHLKGRMGG